MTSKSKKRMLCSLRFVSSPNYQKNLALLIRLINDTPENAIIVAPEVCLSGFDYEHFDIAADFASEALQRLLECSAERIIILTLIERRSDGIYNVAKVLHKRTVVHEQAKAKLFRFGGEHDYFAQGSDEEIVLFEVDGLKIGMMICFELRFKTFWQKLEGADIIAIPSRWGKLRTENFETLTQALAILNQCYVIASDAANDDATGKSGIITPFGESKRNGNRLCLQVPYNDKELRKMRRYMNVGIDG